MQNNSNQNFKNAKREWNSPLNIFLSFVLVVSLLLSFVNITGAWFTDDSTTGKTISAIIKTGEANLNVYQEDSAGTQTMLSKSLPAGYTQLEYIESTGTQYIDTGYVPNSNSQFDITFLVNQANLNVDCPLFGVRTSGSGNSYTFWCHGVGYSAATYSALIFNDKENRISNFKLNNKHHVTLKNGLYSINGVNTSFTKVGEGTPNQNLILFGLANGASIDGRKFVGLVYSFKISENNALKRNFIPAKNSSGTIGMYDLVEGKFYTNKGTGTFVAGAEQKSGSGISLAYDTTNKTNNKVDVENTNNVKLLLKNEDLGSSFGVRYKVTFYAATASGKVELSSSISGMTAPTSSSNGFVFNSTDGYYYYQNNTGANAMFEPATSSGATSKYLMTGFSINYTNATKTLLGGNSIYMEISIESVNLG